MMPRNKKVLLNLMAFREVLFHKYIINMPSFHVKAKASDYFSFCIVQCKSRLYSV